MGPEDVSHGQRTLAGVRTSRTRTFLFIHPAIIRGQAGLASVGNGGKQDSTFELKEIIAVARFFEAIYRELAAPRSATDMEICPCSAAKFMVVRSTSGAAMGPIFFIKPVFHGFCRRIFPTFPTSIATHPAEKILQRPLFIAVILG